MKNCFIICLFIMGLASCTSETETIKNDELAVTRNDISIECGKFGNSLQNVADVLNKDTVLLNHLFEYNYVYETRGTVSANETDKEKTNELLSGLVAQSEKLLKSYEIEEIDELSDEDKVVLSILLYSEYMDNNALLTRGDITGNHYVDCALAALGISDVTEAISNGIENYIKKYGAKKALKAVAKVAGKSVSAIGWGIVAYDFATCI